MENNELYLKTAFCCMACDGNIAEEEVQLIKDYVAEQTYFEGLDAKTLLNRYIESINKDGISFLNAFLTDIRNIELTEEQEMNIVKIAIEMIEADNVIKYSEIKFFKKIRQYLNLTDETILNEMPDKEDYLLPDIINSEYEFIQDIAFPNLLFDIITIH